ncbi:MAG: DUF309 domain-containing protein [Aestuariivita sp.]|uniref:DUF309 domain-containing protein n=1 Tax=Aestuariivita sp. TaxID=1872407 RepID=UPI003BB04B58
MHKIRLPDHAYVPGETARHAEGAFDSFHDSVTPGMGRDALQHTLAWRAGLLFLEQGYFWEAHEVLEPVWMATPHDSAEHQMVQGAIQLANAALKQVMNRPAAARRLCERARGHARAARSSGGDIVMGMEVADLEQKIESLEAQLGSE